MTPLKSMTSFNLKTTGKLLWNKRKGIKRAVFYRKMINVVMETVTPLHM